MHPEMTPVKCTIMRGGTSKGIFIKDNDLPRDEEKRNAVIRAVFGSPDMRQIDGLGGADVLTSKLAIIGPSSSEEADVDYTFGQVSYETEFIDYNGNCGNISSGVGPYAIDEGMVKAVEPFTTVRINMTNSNRVIYAEVPVKNGKAQVAGEFAIDGCPGTGAKITMDWRNAAGSITGKLLPTGNVRDNFEIDGKTYEVSIVDAGNAVVFIKAPGLGMTGIETPDEIENNKQLMETIEKIRGHAAVKMGLAATPEDATLKSPYNPFFAIVSPPSDYETKNKGTVKAEECDLVSRLLFMLFMHKTYPVSGTVCTGAAARIPGSIVWEVMREEAKDRLTINIGHPGGIIPVESEARVEDDEIVFSRIGVYRTARRIMDGMAYVRNSVLG